MNRAGLSEVYRNSYLGHIDTLRAIAVVAVVLYHLDPRLLPGGFVGVDVFFVISGYIVSRSVRVMSQAVV